MQALAGLPEIGVGGGELSGLLWCCVYCCFLAGSPATVCWEAKEKGKQLKEGTLSAPSCRRLSTDWNKKAVSFCGWHRSSFLFDTMVQGCAEIRGACRGCAGSVGIAGKVIVPQSGMWSLRDQHPSWALASHAPSGKDFWWFFGAFSFFFFCFWSTYRLNFWIGHLFLFCFLLYTFEHGAQFSIVQHFIVCIFFTFIHFYAYFAQHLHFIVTEMFTYCHKEVTVYIIGDTFWIVHTWSCFFAYVYDILGLHVKHISHYWDLTRKKRGTIDQCRNAPFLIFVYWCNTIIYISTGAVYFLFT